MAVENKLVKGIMVVKPEQGIVIFRSMETGEEFVLLMEELDPIVNALHNIQEGQEGFKEGLMFPMVLPVRRDQEFADRLANVNVMESLPDKWKEIMNEQAEYKTRVLGLDMDGEENESVASAE